jgi:CO/xanthine dehydrogenase FAD-binding subunit
MHPYAQDDSAFDSHRVALHRAYTNDMGAYFRPKSLQEALGIAGRNVTVLAGGTDFYPARVGRSIDENILDISALAELHGISESDAGWRLGATTTWSELIEAPLPALFDGLKQAAREVGGRQIQNAGTLAGNLCNASPAADGVPPLLTLDAELELAGPIGGRRLPLADFILGNRRTALAPGELVVAIHVSRASHAARGKFLKLGARRYLIISIVMVAATLEVEGDRVTRARVAVGACSEVARRLPLLEAALQGAPAGALAERVHPGHLASLSPIDDVRGSAAYRNDAVLTMLRRVLA